MGGIESFTKNLASALTKKNCAVTVVTNDTNSCGAGFSYEGGVRVLRLPCISLINTRLPLPSPSLKRTSLLKELHGTCFDGVVVNARFYPHSLLGMRFAKANALRPIVIEHGSSYLAFGSPIADEAARHYERIITRIGKRYEPLYFGVSRNSAEWLKEFSIEAEGVIHNSIDAQEYRSIAADRKWRDELGIDNDTVLLVYAGRLLPEKGLPVLLDSLKRIEDSGLRVMLAIAGEGKLSDLARKSESKSCRYLGCLDRGELSALLRDADCLCLPTTYPEGLPTVLLEAAVQNTAILVSNCAGAKEVVPDDSFGLVLDDISPNSLSNAITRFALDRNYLESCKKSVSARVSMEFSWDNTAEELAKLIASGAVRAYRATGDSYVQPS